MEKEIITSDVLNVIDCDGVPYLSFPQLEALGVVCHGFTTRLGGVSSGDCSSMNLSYTRGDDPKNVEENYIRVCKAMDIRKEKIICSSQSHTNCVIMVDEKLAGNGVEYENQLNDVDGFVTNVPGICLLTMYADCVPLYFVDPVKKVIGLSHSGWRGTVQKIGAVTIQKMVEEYGCNLQDIYAAIGPSICQSCYEVSGDVIDEFKHVFQIQYWEDLFYRKFEDKYHLNLWKANEIILLEQGIRKEHLIVTDVCTCCNSEVLFSHRASGGKRGNLAALLMIKEEKNG